MAIQNWAGLYICQIWLHAPSSVLFSRRRPRRELVCKNDQAQFWQNATRLLPVSHFYTWLLSSTIGPDHIVRNHPGSNLSLADCVWFEPNKSGLEARRCASLGPLLDRAGLDPACLLEARQSASSLPFGLPTNAGTISVTPVVTATSSLVLLSVNDMVVGFLPATQQAHSLQSIFKMVLNRHLHALVPKHISTKRPYTFWLTDCQIRGFVSWYPSVRDTIWAFL